MRYCNKRRGLTTAEIIIIVVLACALGAGGYYYYNRMMKRAKQESANGAASSYISACYMEYAKSLAGLAEFEACPEPGKVHIDKDFRISSVRYSEGPPKRCVFDVTGQDGYVYLKDVAWTAMQ